MIRSMFWWINFLTKCQMKNKAAVRVKDPDARIAARLICIIASGSFTLALYIRSSGILLMPLFLYLFTYRRIV